MPEEIVRPYQLDDAELEARLDEMVAVTFADLTSQFMLLPRGNAFLTYEEFRDGYEALRMATKGFTDVTTATCWTALKQDARADAAALVGAMQRLSVDAADLAQALNTPGAAQTDLAKIQRDESAELVASNNLRYKLGLPAASVPAAS